MEFEHYVRLEDHLISPGGYEAAGGQDSSDTSCNTSTATHAVQGLRHATVASIDCSRGGQKSH